MQTIWAEWLKALTQTGQTLFVRESPLETGILITVFILISSLVFILIARTLTGSRARVICVMWPGFLVLIAASAAASAFWSDQLIPQIISIAGALFVLVLPWTKRMQKTFYLNAFFLWMVLLLFVGAVFYAESIVVRAVRNGTGSGSLLKQHNNQMNTLFKEMDK